MKNIDRITLLIALLAVGLSGWWIDKSFPMSVIMFGIGTAAIIFTIKVDKKESQNQGD